MIKGEFDDGITWNLIDELFVRYNVRLGQNASKIHIHAVFSIQNTKKTKTLKKGFDLSNKFSKVFFYSQDICSNELNK